MPSLFASGVPLTESALNAWVQALMDAAPPAGVVSWYAGATAPTGYLLCDGSAVSRTTYAALYAAIGTTYGTGDGSTTFNVPDMRGRMPVGKGSHTDCDALGDNDGVAAGSRTPKHTHEQNYNTQSQANALTRPVTLHTDGILYYSDGSGGISSLKVAKGGVSSGSGSYLTLNAIIKT